MFKFDLLDPLHILVYCSGFCSSFKEKGSEMSPCALLLHVWNSPPIVKTDLLWVIYTPDHSEQQMMVSQKHFIMLFLVWEPSTEIKVLPSPLPLFCQGHDWQVQVEIGACCVYTGKLDPSRQRRNAGSLNPTERRNGIHGYVIEGCPEGLGQ